LYPFIGNAYTLLRLKKYLREDEHPFIEAPSMHFGNSDPKVYGMALLGTPVMVIRDPAMIE